LVEYFTLFCKELPNGWRYWQVAGVDSAWEQYKLEVEKMLENGDDSHLPACPW
jgi:hypothetical protein